MSKTVVYEDAEAQLVAEVFADPDAFPAEVHDLAVAIETKTA